MMDTDKLLTLHDLLAIQKQIDEIESILGSNPFQEELARKKIREIDLSHPENQVIHNMFFFSTKPVTRIANANDEHLKYDLEWKELYLCAKHQGKTLNELIKAWYEKQQNTPLYNNGGISF